MNRLFASVVFALVTTLQIAEAEESRSPTAQEIIIRGKFIAPYAGAIAARKSSWGFSVMTFSGQVALHSPHCTQASSAKRSTGRS